MPTEYYDNGQIKYEIWYNKDGSKKSSHLYFENGQRKEVHHFKTGASSSWYENGNLKIERIRLNNKLHGKWKQFYENGVLAQEGSFKDGVPIGNWTHITLEDKNSKLAKKDGSLRYWKFVVNASIRYGEVLDENNTGLIELKFIGKPVKNPKTETKTRKIFDGAVIINNKRFDNTRYVFDGKQLITFHPISYNSEAYKNKLVLFIELFQEYDVING